MNNKWSTLVFSSVLLGALLVPGAQANVGNEEIVVTVKHAPVEIPGRVLEPGKYQVEFPHMERRYVEISTAHGGKPIGLFPVSPISRVDRTDHARLELAKAAPGSPERVTGFFYPGMKTGYRFEYPRAQVAQVARNTKSLFLRR